MYNYGIMLSKVIFINEKEACKYFKMAADKGDIESKSKYTQLIEIAKKNHKEI